MPPPRPTLRCIREDLQSDWGDTAHQRAVTDLDSCPPLSGLDHPAIQHLSALFGVEDGASLNRESISGLTDPMWWKLKTSRWRGAVYVDDDGQTWLCAAGLRRAGEKSDFYSSFTREIGRLGAAHFLPTAEDKARLRREVAEARLATWEESLYTSAVTALASAQISGRASFDVPGLAASDPALASATVEVAILTDDDPEDSIGEIVVAVTPRDWARQELLARAEIVLLAAISPDEQSWVAGHSAKQRIFSVTDSAEAVEALVAQSASADRTPGETRAGAVSHYTHKSRLAEHYVIGSAARALCGVYFVPRQDPEGMAICPQCETVFRSLEAT